MNELAKALGPDQPFYGLQAQGVDGREPPLERIEEMATRYLAEVRALQPNGPYYLGGYCGGGLIAFEMAQQLAREGEQTALLVLLDTYHPGLKLHVPTLAERAERVSLEGPAYLWRRGRDRLARELKTRSKALRVQWHHKRGEAVPYELRDLQLTYAFLEAAARYQPTPFAGRLTVLHARDSHFDFEGAGEALGWTGFGTHGLSVETVPGDHETMMVPPNVQELALRLKEKLAQAREAEGAAKQSVAS